MVAHSYIGWKRRSRKLRELKLRFHQSLKSLPLNVLNHWLTFLLTTELAE